MRKTWFLTITAAACAMGSAAITAEGGPADYLPWVNKSEPEAVPPVVSQSSRRPTDKISPVRNPVKYMAAAISEMPGPASLWKKDGSKAAPAAPDTISLETPTGPPTPQLVIAMAQVCEGRGDIAQARKQYQKALRKWPGQVDVLRAAAKMEDRLGGLQLAENLYQQAVDANPGHAGALNDLGMCLARQGKLTQSAQVLERAVSLQPTKPLYRNNLAVVLVWTGQDQRALAHLAAVHGPAEANYNMGQMLMQRGRPQDAAGYYAAALEIDPNMQAAQAALSSLQGQMAGGVPGAVSNADGLPMTPSAVPVTTPTAPQAEPVVGPQLGFPATAQHPAWGTTSYVPPGYYVPQQPVPQYPQYPPHPQQVAPQVSQAPTRSLPALHGQQQTPAPVRRY